MTTSTRKTRLDTGIKITNPLRLPVRVYLTSKTGALHIGTHYAASRIIMPNETLTVKTKGKCDVDIKVDILRYDETGRENKVGAGGFIKEPGGVQMGPITLSNGADVMSRHWRIIERLTVPEGYFFILNEVGIRLKTAAEARIEIPGSSAPYRVTRSQDLQFQQLIIRSGGLVTVKGRSRTGSKGAVAVEIRGHMVLNPPAGESPEPPTEEVKPEPKIKDREESEEPELRSLGDMIEDLRKKEEEVKV